MGSDGDGVDHAARRSAGYVDRLPDPETVDRRRVEVRQQEDAEFRGLVRRVADGDEEALTTLYDKAGARIYGLLLRVLGSPERATAVTQEVFVEVWRQARRYHPSQGMVFAWIVAIAHQRGIESARAAAGHAAPASPATAPDVSRGINEVWAVIEQRFGSARVRAGLKALSYVQRQTLLLAYFEGFTQRQVASHLDIPLHAVRRQMLDGLVNLRRALGVADD